MKKTLAIALCMLVPMSVFAGDGGYKVDYDGGSIQNLKSGTNMKLYIESIQIRLAKGNETFVIIPTAAVTEISYGQDVHRRIGAAIGIGVVTLGVGALMALTKSKKHFVGLTWANGEQRAVSRCSVIRTITAAS